MSWGYLDLFPGRLYCWGYAEKQSTGSFKSELHHVTAPRHFMCGEEVSEDTVVDRYALAFYVHPDYEPWWSRF